MRVKDIMHDVTKVPSTITVMEAAKIMDNKVIGSVLVEENNEIVGMVTERDILRKIVAAGRRCEETTLRDIASSPLITVDSDASLEEASDLMTQHKIRRLVVVENNQIVGVVSARNIVENIRYSLGRRLAGYASGQGLLY